MDWRKLLFGDVSSEDEVEVEETEPIKFESEIIWHKGETVREVVASITESKNVPYEEVVENISRAIDEDKILLIDPSPPRTFLTYFMSNYSIWFWAVVLFIVILFSSIFLLPQTYPQIFVRYIVGSIFILYIPGFTLIEALYPGSKELERLERFALDIGLSIALVPLVGLILNYTPWGIRLEPILTALSITVVILGIFGLWRKYSLFKLTLLTIKK